MKEHMKEHTMFQICHSSEMVSQKGSIREWNTLGLDLLADTIFIKKHKHEAPSTNLKCSK